MRSVRSGHCLDKLHAPAYRHMRHPHSSRMALFLGLTGIAAITSAPWLVMTMKPVVPDQWVGPRARPCLSGVIKRNRDTQNPFAQESKLLFAVAREHAPRPHLHPYPSPCPHRRPHTLTRTYIQHLVNREARRPVDQNQLDQHDVHDVGRTGDGADNSVGNAICPHISPVDLEFLRPHYG